jgi:hypothetical protein
LVWNSGRNQHSPLLIVEPTIIITIQL